MTNTAAPSVPVRLRDVPPMLSISETTFRGLVKAGKIKTLQLGKRAKGVMPEEIERFLQNAGQ